MSFDASIFRTYDIRGTYPEQMSEEVAYAIGQSFVKVTGAQRVVVGRDVRVSGPSLQQAMIEGVTDAGATAINIGVISTEMLYFAAGTLDCDGGMSATASHNPKQWNGCKFIGKDAVPLQFDELYPAIQNHQQFLAPTKGLVEEVDLLPAYAQFLQKFAPQDLPRTIKLAINVNYGANGKVVDAATKNLNLDITRLNWEEDGNFPKGTPDPLLPQNREEIQALVRSSQADFGVAFDADADRCFIYDEQGRFFPGYYITAMIIKHLLDQEPGGTVVIEPRLTWASTNAALEAGGKTHQTLAGHTNIKRAMRQYQAVFGGEISGHYYYRDFFFCDNGMISFLTILKIFTAHLKDGGKVSEILDRYLEKYPITQEELNFKTDKAAEIIESAAKKYADAQIDRLDGVSVEYPDWRFNLRMSNTEPVLRLNLEAHTLAVVDTRLAEVRSFIEGFGATLRDDSK